VIRAAAPFVVAALMTAPAFAAEPDAPVLALAAAWNAADVDAWGRQFWPDSEFTNIRGQVFHGIAENKAQHARIWATHYLGSHLDVRLLRVWPLGPDHSLVDTEARVTNFKSVMPGVALAEPDTLVTRFRTIVERRNSEWRILFTQNTVVTPPGPPAAR